MTFEEYLSSLKGKTVGVIGVGVSNRPLIEKLLERGIDVTARDKKEDLGELGQALTAQGCKLRLGSKYLADLHENVIFRTPGLRPDVPELAAAVAGGSVITSEMEAFFAVCPCPILAVTGSDGKTTTTTIISKLLAAEGKIVHVGGNIGHPLLCDTPEIAPEDMAVLELSSFQLMTMQTSPHIAVTTNLEGTELQHRHILRCDLRGVAQQRMADIAAHMDDLPLRRQQLGDNGGGGRLAVGAGHRQNGTGADCKECLHLRGDDAAAGHSRRQLRHIRPQTGGAEDHILMEVRQVFAP